jgi:hypothetical protein
MSDKLPYSFVVTAWNNRAESTLQFGPYVTEELAELAVAKLVKAGWADVGISALNPAHMLLSPDAVCAWGGG